MFVNGVAELCREGKGELMPSQKQERRWDRGDEQDGFALSLGAGVYCLFAERIQMESQFLVLVWLFTGGFVTVAPQGAEHPFRP